MKLINGIPSNGTFQGIIPDVREDSKIKYTLYFEDEYGYVGSFGEERGDRATFIDRSSPSVNNITIGYVEPHKPIVVRANVFVPEDGIKNVTLNYKVLQYPNGSRTYSDNLKEVS